jgi:hypothetical protein
MHRTRLFDTGIELIPDQESKFCRERNAKGRSLDQRSIALSFTGESGKLVPENQNSINDFLSIADIFKVFL